MHLLHRGEDSPKSVTSLLRQKDGNAAPSEVRGGVSRTLHREIGKCASLEVKGNTTPLGHYKCLNRGPREESGEKVEKKPSARTAYSRRHQGSPRKAMWWATMTRSTLE